MAADNRYDLRSGLADQRRDRDHRHKWMPRWAAHGNPAAMNRDSSNSSHREVRPWGDKSPEPFTPVHFGRSIVGEQRRRRGKHARRSNLTDPAQDRDDDFTSDNYHMDRSIEQERMEIRRSPVHDMTDTGTGESVLQHAVNKAEHKFEDKQTTKMVKDEYDVVEDRDDEDPSTGESVDDDFEML